MSLIYYKLPHRNWQQKMFSTIVSIKILECPIPPTTTAARPSQKPSNGDISGTKRGIIDPLVSKQPENILKKKI